MSSRTGPASPFKTSVFASPTPSRANWTHFLPRRNAELLRGAFALSAALLDITAIVLAAACSGLIYHKLHGYDEEIVETFTRVGFVTAALFLIPNFMKARYSIAEYLTFRSHLRNALRFWNMTFVIMMALGFLTKTMSIYSRSTAVVFYVLGFALLIASRGVIVKMVRLGARNRGFAASRLFLVGSEEEISKFSDRYPMRAEELSLSVVAACVLRPDREFLEEDLALAAASARMIRPDDIFILVAWSEKTVIEKCVNAFLRVPAAIHLGPERVLEGFGDANISKIGPITSLNLVRRPLSVFELVVKRAFDIVLAGLGLIVLSPLFLVMAILIKLDSEGPVFFLQRRYGFNQEPFRIVKFRSMTTMEDSADVQQVARGDVRITRVGRFIRRFNLDELPQLLNVLHGDMSLVGPRPHALAHDQQFERTIALYARRHNVRPGITGWAQVNGFRGEISSQDKIAARIEHDLFYIDNWSLSLDISIIAMTILSPKAYRNAM